LIGGSLVAGYAGKVVLAGLESRMTAALATRRAAASDLAARRARQDADRLAARIVGVSTSSTSPRSDAAMAELQRLARELQTQHSDE
jgi:hypothetical protein